MQVVKDDSNLLVAEQFLSRAYTRATPEFIREVVDGLNTLVGRPIVLLKISIKSDQAASTEHKLAVVYLDPPKSGDNGGYSQGTCVIYKDGFSPFINQDARLTAVVLYR